MEDDEDTDAPVDQPSPSPVISRNPETPASSSQTTACPQQPDPEPEINDSPEVKPSSERRECLDREATLGKEAAAASESLPPGDDSGVLCINFNTVKAKEPVVSSKNFCGERSFGITDPDSCSGIPLFLLSLDSCAPPKFQRTTRVAESSDSPKNNLLENVAFADEDNENGGRGGDGDGSRGGGRGSGYHGDGALKASLLNDRLSSIFTLERCSSSLDSHSASELGADSDISCSWNGDGKDLAWRENPLWVRNTDHNQHHQYHHHHPDTQLWTTQTWNPRATSRREPNDDFTDESPPDYTRAVQLLRKERHAPNRTTSPYKTFSHRSSFNPRNEAIFLAPADSAVNISVDKKDGKGSKSLRACTASLSDAEKIVDVPRNGGNYVGGSGDDEVFEELEEEEEVVVVGEEVWEAGRADGRGLRRFLPCTSRRPRRLTKARIVAFVLKYVLFLITFLFWVTSAAAIAVGAWVVSERGQLVRDSASIFLDPSAMLCLLGAITFVVSFCGCLGALRENICLLQVFAMVGVLVLEFLVALLVFAFYQIPEFRKNLTAGPEEVLTNAIRRYYDDDGLRRWVDLLQTELKCCGARHSDTGYMDWQLNPYFNCTPHNPSAQRCGVPVTCCIIERGEYINHMCGFATTNKPRREVYHIIYTQGCMKGLGQWLSAHEAAVGAFSLTIILPQIVCITLARLFVLHIRRQRVRWRMLHTKKSIYSRNSEEQGSSLRH